jgi:hypothetical protein
MRRTFPDKLEVAPGHQDDKLLSLLPFYTRINKEYSERKKVTYVNNMRDIGEKEVFAPGNDRRTLAERLGRVSRAILSLKGTLNGGEEDCQRQ